ncbi:MAG: DHHW family protein [Oscillospiraceae bacterium]
MTKLSALAQRLSVLFFFGFLVILCVGSILSRGKVFSEKENRALADFPSPTLSSYINGSFMDGVDGFAADHLFFRDSWTALHIRLRLACGASSVNGVYFLENRYADRTTDIPAAGLDQSVAAVKSFAQSTKIPVYMMLVPSAAGIYFDDLSPLEPNADQKSIIYGVYEALGKDVIPLDAYSVLYSARDEYIYYRNDMHWTPLGAYYAYTAAAAKMGNGAVKLSNYDIRHVSDGFYGSYYAQAPLAKYEADSIDLYTPKNGVSVESVEVYDTNENVRTYQTLYFSRYLEGLNKYNYYLGAPSPLMKITTNSESGKKLLVVKDSFAQCFLPYLTQHYSSITVVDLSCSDESFSALADGDYDQILLLYGIGDFAGGFGGKLDAAK